MKRISLPEIYVDERVMEAAQIITDSRIAEIVKPLESTPPTESLHEALTQLRNDEIDGVVAGASFSTATVIRAGLKTLGLREGCSTVSSTFLMEKDDNVFFFSDCAVVPNPTPEQFADITAETARTARLLGTEPRIAFLSLSTNGSASVPSVEAVRESLALTIKKHPELDIDPNEVQVDTALNTAIAQSKYPESRFASQPANTLIFPDGASGNIGYKLTEQLAGYTAVGPILQGFSRPLNDLSRGCSVEDIVELVKITVKQSEA